MSKSSFLTFALGLTLVVWTSGCASSTQTASQPRGKGHWITVEPEVGSRLPKRVWVNDDGTAEAAPGVGTLSPAAFERTQQQSLGAQPPGSGGH